MFPQYVEVFHLTCHSLVIDVCVFCQMLRTCSLPDLSKLFSDAVEREGSVAPENNLEVEDLEDKGDEPSETEE